MKPVKTLITLLSYVAFAMASFIPQASFSQCTALKSISYDTLVNGNGNITSVLDLPQFDPSKGTLIAVKIASVISLQYGFQLENNSHSAASFEVGVGRNDFVLTSALSQPLMNLGNIIRYYGPYSLAASNGVSGSGPDFISVPSISVLSDYPDIVDSITGGITGFIGTGAVEFDYTTTTYYDLSGSYAFNFTASDTLNFTVTYYYCDKPAIAPSLTSFNAKIEGENTVNLAWETSNEQPDRNYTIQKSDDGIHFDDLVAIKSLDDSILASYFYDYGITSKDTSEIYFRLKITDTTPDVQYSSVRSVKLQETSGAQNIPAVLSLYPNPSNTFVNILLNQPNNNWQIDIISANGVKLQRYFFASTSLAHIGFVKKLPPGVYFIHAVDLDRLKSYVLPFMMQ